MNVTSPLPTSTLTGENSSNKNALNGRDDAAKPNFGVRIADVSALMPDGSTVIGQRKIPTLPQFDRAFGAFAQGTLMQTDAGFTAIEDLQPGDLVMTAKGVCEEVTWIGSALFAAADPGDRMRLTRITADSFGLNRPTNSVSLGSAARVLQTPPDLKATVGSKPVLTPVSHFVDGVGVIDVAPPTATRLFHIALKRHSALIAGGLEVESYHPGPQALQLLSHTLRTVYLSCFPHITQMSDFGPMTYQRLEQVDGQTAA